MIDFKNIRKHQHIIVYFVIAIVFPCLILGILAFRGIRNDQALIEKQQRKKAERKAADVNGYILDVSNGIADAFSLLVNQSAIPASSLFHDSGIHSFVVQNPLVLAVFHINKERLSMLKASCLFIPDDAAEVFQDKNIVLDIDYDRAWHYEYREKDYHKAIEIYREALDNASSKEQKALAINILARLYKKINDKEESLKLYHQIVSDHSHVRIDGKMPLGLAAQLELTQLYMEETFLGISYESLVNLYSDLLSMTRLISQSTFDFFSHRIEQLDQSLRTENLPFVITAKMDSLKEREEILYTSTIRLSDFRNNVLVELNEPKIERDQIDLKKVIHNAHSQDVSHRLIADKYQGYWGILLDKRALLSSKLMPFLENKDSDDSWTWNIQDEKGEYLVPFDSSKNDRIPLKFSLPNHWQEYTLIAYAEPKPLYITVLQDEQGVYFIMFVVIAIILITGISLVILLINRELQLNELKSNFIATVSHEFKSPLTAIKQMAEMFQNDRVPENRRHKYYQVMMQEGERLTHLVDNILDMARIEQGAKRYDFKMSDIRETLTRTIDQYVQRYAEKGIRFNLTTEADLPKVLMDEEAIQQVLHNLIDNSIKYSGGSNQIDLDATRDNGAISVAIKDYGIGISKYDQSKIFDRFYRIKSGHTSGIKGSGIGLALVKRIIEAHKGNIRVDSKLEKGSTFTFQLPLTKNIDS